MHGQYAIKIAAKTQIRTSSSIFASAISCSLPFPLAIFCASVICDLTASILKSSKGKPSTALMLSSEFGCTIAKPPDTAPTPLGAVIFARHCYVRKKDLFPPASSVTTSTTPGFNCSIEGTWFARTPISPDSAGMLTCTTSWALYIDYSSMR